MKRFVSSVVAMIMIMGLGSLTLPAHADTRAVPYGDTESMPANGLVSDAESGSNTGDGSGGGSGAGTGDGSGGAGEGTGGGSAGGPGGTGDSGTTVPGLSTPRVMLSGFSSTPAEVEAGQDFTISFTLRNTSKRTRVDNIKVSLSSGEGAAFLPADGSSSIYIPRISADDSSIQSMTFHSLSSLEERPYQMQLNVEYEDAVANAYSSTEMVSVSVKQKVRADTSVPQVMPEAIMVGQDASVTFNIHNQGKTKLFNAKAVVKEGQAVTGEEIFVGTIEPGTSGAVDMLVHADDESEAPVVIEVTYEDAEGTVTALSKELPMSVMPMDMGEEFPMEEMPMEEPGLGLLPLIVAGIALLLILLLVVLLVRRSRRRSRERDDMDSLSMISDEPLVPNDSSQG